MAWKGEQLGLPYALSADTERFRRVRLKQGSLHAFFLKMINEGEGGWGLLNLFT